MTSYEFDFNMDIQQKKRIASGAYHVKRGSKSKKCTLPSDNMTDKQKKEMNGPVETYDLNRPISWSEFTKMPRDLQQEYIDRIQERFDVSKESVAAMLGVRYKVLLLYFKENELNWKPIKKKTDTERLKELAKFREWSGVQAERPKEKKETTLAEIGKAVVSAKNEESVTTRSKVLMSGGRLEMSGKAQDICTKIFAVLGNQDIFDVQIDFKVSAMVVKTD